MGVDMRFLHEMRREAGQNDRKPNFSRFKDAAERSARVAVTALAFAFTVHCGGGNETGERPDGGDGGARPVETDTGGSGGSDTAVRASELCSTYDTGDSHKRTFRLNDEATPSAEGYVFRFRGISPNGSSIRAEFLMVAPVENDSETWALTEGTTTSQIFPTIGKVSFQMCEMTPNVCSPSGGDTACAATLASSNAWK
jgi:hypothetical protein